MLKTGLNLQLIYSGISDKTNNEYSLAEKIMWAFAFFLWSGSPICYSFVQNFRNFKSQQRLTTEIQTTDLNATTMAELESDSARTSLVEQGEEAEIDKFSTVYCELMTPRDIEERADSKDQAWSSGLGMVPSSNSSINYV